MPVKPNQGIQVYTAVDTVFNTMQTQVENWLADPANQDKIVYQFTDGQYNISGTYYFFCRIYFYG